MKRKHKVGIIGIGMVGGACKFGFEKLGHEVVFHDTAYGTKIDDVLDAEAVFVCVPTPPLQDGSCDVSIVETVIKQLKQSSYAGVVAIKSTVEPGTTLRLREETGLNVCFVPEFLRERCAVSDFVENHVLLAVGCCDDDTYELLKDLHGSYPKKSIMLGVQEAEFLKYYSNVFNALRIIFANEFYETCLAVGASYDDIKNAYVMTGAVPDRYLDVNENFRGYGGVCVPPDALCKVRDMYSQEECYITIEQLYEIIKEQDLEIESTNDQITQKEWKYVRHATRRDVSENLYVFELDSGEFTCTAGHLLPIFRNGKNLLVRADCVQETDEVFVAAR